MMVEVKLPQLSMGVIDCELKRWLRQVGDVVAEGDALAEVDTDKTVTEINSPASGTLVEIRHQAGETVNVGDVLAVIAEG